MSASRVVDEDVFSDHKAVRYVIGSPPPNNNLERAGNRWRTNMFDENIFRAALQHAGICTAELNAEEMERVLVDACDATMSRITGTRTSKRNAFWWTSRLTELRKAVHQAYRRKFRAYGTDAYEERCEEYKQARRIMKRDILLCRALARYGARCVLRSTTPCYTRKPTKLLTSVSVASLVLPAMADPRA